MNRSRLAIVRSGYTTLMELAALGKRAVLIPTPGQTEQEYLVDYHRELGHYSGALQHTLDLRAAVEAPPPSHPYVPPHQTDESVRRFLDVIEDC